MSQRQSDLNLHCGPGSETLLGSGNNIHAHGKMGSQPNGCTWKMEVALGCRAETHPAVSPSGCSLCPFEDQVLEDSDLWTA